MMICTEEGALNGLDQEFESLEAAKAFVCKQCDAWAAYKRAQILAPISPYEAASWPLKLAEAKAFPDSPSLAIEAYARGVPTEAIVAKVLEKAQQLAMLEAMLAGLNGKHCDNIKALATMEEVLAYDWRFEV